MGTVWETLAVYGLQGLLWFLALYRRGARPCIVVLGLSLAVSWAFGEAFEGNDRIAANILLDLGVIIAMRHFHTDAHQRLVALLAQISIGIHAAYAGVRYTDHHTYAVALNCVVCLQLLIAGGWIDQWGRSLDHWLDRMDPRWSRAVRALAT